MCGFPTLGSLSFLKRNERNGKGKKVTSIIVDDLIDEARRESKPSGVQ